MALAKLSSDDSQPDLPTFDARHKRGRVVDAARDKFGYDLVHLASTVPKTR